MIVRWLGWLYDHPRLIRIGFICLLGLLIVVDLFVPRHQAHFLGDVIPGFWALFGFAACVVIIIFSKWLGTAFLFRPDTYYQDLEKTRGTQS